MSHYVPWFIEGETPWISQDFWEMPWQRAEKFTRWFAESAPVRIRTLGGFVQSSPGFEAWRADCSRHSFEVLGVWFLQTVALRHSHKEDARSVPKPKRVGFDEPGPGSQTPQRDTTKVRWEYSDRALARSVLADIGTYMAECLRSAVPTCRWARCKDKKDMNFNQPLLLWPNDPTVGFLAMREPSAAATAMIEGSWTSNGFAEMYEDRLKLARFEPVKVTPIQKRSGLAVAVACPQCGFTFGRVAVAEGKYCNHCGHLEGRG